RAGDSVEIGVSLVDGTTQQYVADPIVRRSDLRDIERLYRGLTAAIAAEIQFALTPQAEARLASAREVSPQVYEAYLEGQFHWGQGTPAGLDLALDYFQRALVLDSTYAPAQAGIAAVWSNRAGLGFVTQREAAPHVSAAARRALALDSTLTEVHIAVARVRIGIEWDWQGAEAALRKAIEINPNHAVARAHYAAFLAWMGRPEEARAQMERALELDPVNPTLMRANGYLLCYERRYAECSEAMQAALRIAPDNRAVYSNLAWAYHETGDHDEALAMIRKFFPGDRELDEALDRGYAEGGYRGALRRYAETLAARPEAAEKLSWIVAYIYAWAGEKERTLEWLELAFQAHDPNLLAFNSPDFELVHDDPRYHDLRRRMNLPP
ncbi:MAG: tetratricopeptide repeat protein, partial [Gemmatimonadota bacterium]